MYVDVIFFENLVINYIILYLTKIFSRQNTSAIKLFLGSFIGSFYVILFFFNISFILQSIILKIILSIVIILVCFAPLSAKNFFRILSLFYLISFIFGGASFALLYLFNYNIKIIFLALIVSVILIYINWGSVTKISRNKKLIYHIDIEIFSKHAQVKAFLDTGNNLFDPLSNSLVAIVEFSALCDILPKEFKNIFREGGKDNIEKIYENIENKNWINRIRLIPFMSIGKENGILIGFKPDKFIINDFKKEIKDIIIGIYGSKLNKEGDYSALIGPEFLV
ncbi:MAG: sigma-E processing peptidase SpoIIGA [Thermoanaerobacteraceae bacterium]